jgi:hypothetical protein
VCLATVQKSLVADHFADYQVITGLLLKNGRLTGFADYFPIDHLIPS